MHSCRAVTIVARFILLTVCSRGAIAAAPGADSTAEANTYLGHADATFLVHTDEDELLAAIVSARISEPDRVAGVLNELRVESTGHLGRLDLEEWSEMMAEMRSGGVALGSRNKLRLLVAAQSSRSHTGGHVPSGGRRRVQAGSGDEESSSRAVGRPSDSTSATKQASEQESTNKQDGTVFGVSGDSTLH
jgi:hypothetical protein